MTSNYQFLEMLHRELKPRGYLEIGVRHGDSLRLAQCPAIGIDPNASVPPYRTAPVPCVYEMTSDEFFAQAEQLGALELFDVDLVYIDGMHLYEYALRDFVNVARWANERTVVVFDDTHPYNQAIATRAQPPGDWTGDVWKAMDIIDLARDGLNLNRAQVDVSPTGAFVVWGFAGEASDQVERYLSHMFDSSMMMKDIPVPVDIVERTHTITPEEVIQQILRSR